MKVIQDIIKVLKCDAEYAERVREQMAMDGLDFSECTQREFIDAIHKAHNFLRMSDAGIWVIG